MGNIRSSVSQILGTKGLTNNEVNVDFCLGRLMH